jgi:hypothetical protein
MNITQYNEEEKTTITFNKDEMRAVRNALNESVNFIEDWEYEIRMGVKKEEVLTMLKHFRGLSQIPD